MNCRTCQYPLWNLPARTCPECGTPFYPSEFEFVPNSVRFMCPHCAQPYYGTGERGHLIPRAFDCVSCSARVSMDEMVLLPTEGVAEERTKLDVLPWAERSTRGFRRAWLATIGMAIARPTRLMRAARDVGPGSAWWFAVVTLLAVGTTAAVPVAMFFAVVAAGGAALGRGAGGGPSPWQMVVPVLAMVLFGVFGSLFLMAIWGALAHALLRLTGDTEGGIGRTYTAIGFSSAVNVFVAIPCIGVYIAFVTGIWWAIAAIFMLREAHKVSGWRASLAALLPPLLAYAAILGLWTFMVMGAMRSVTVARTAAAAAASAPGRPTSQVQTLTIAILSHAAENNGRGPAHMAELFAQGALVPGAVVVQGAGTANEDVTIGTTTLADFFTLDLDRRTREAQREVQRLPDGAAAHRLGDFVFAHHGVNLASPDGRVWIVIYSPNPNTARPAPPTPPHPNAIIPIGLADGSVANFAAPSFAEALAEQNQVRAELGLPALPDPSTVTHSKPIQPGGP